SSVPTSGRLVVVMRTSAGRERGRRNYARGPGKATTSRAAATHGPRRSDDILERLTPARVLAPSACEADPGLRAVRCCASREGLGADLGRESVVVLDGAASMLGPRDPDEPRGAQAAGVVADVAQRLVDAVGEVHGRCVARAELEQDRDLGRVQRAP